MRVSLIMVSFNTSDLTIEALRTAQLSWNDLQLLVVDNASHDGSGDRIEAEFGADSLIRNSENVGFGRAVNQALPKCDGELILLLNPDCQLEPGCMMELVDYLDEHPDAGVVAPLTAHPDARLHVLSAGFEPTIAQVINHYTGLSRFRRWLPSLQGWHILHGVDDASAVDVDWVSGACLLVRRDVLEQVGPLSERWFMYAEDIEFCHRVRAAGWRVVHVPEARVLHLVGAATRQAGEEIRTMWIDSLADYFDLELSSGRVSSRTWRVVLAAGLASRALLYGLRSLSSPSEGATWREESRRFRSFAAAALTARSGA